MSAVSERSRRLLGTAAAAAGLAAVPTPWLTVGDTTLALLALPALSPAPAVATLALLGLTVAGVVLAPGDRARGERLLGTAAGLVLVGVALVRLLGGRVTPGPAAYLAVAAFLLAETGDLLDPGFRNPRTPAGAAVAAMCGFAVAAWCFLALAGPGAWLAGGVATLAWLGAVAWELTAVRDTPAA
jgi:hypothetical protein